jgi:two-component system, cell cycle response regulator
MRLCKLTCQPAPIAIVVLTSNHSLKVLLVEDNLADATLIADLLGSFSDAIFCLQIVSSLEDGIECLQVAEFDAILLDLSVPDYLGRSDTIAILKARSPTVPIVVLTDLNDQHTALSVLRSGAQDCLVKGRFHRTLLVRAIHYAIERQRIEEQLRQQAQRERVLSKMIENIRSSIDATSILQNTVAEVRQFLKTDRVLIYRCQNSAKELGSEKQKYQIVASDGLPKDYIDNPNICSPLAMSCLFLADSKSVQAISDVSVAELSSGGKELLADCEMAAVLSVPIWQSGEKKATNQTSSNSIWEDEKDEDYPEDSMALLALEKPQVLLESGSESGSENDNYLWGILTAYNCTGVRQWQQWEIEFLKHLANQVAIAIEQSQLYRKLAIANQKLQQLATTDGLTQIANRRQFDHVLMLEWRRLGREELPLSLILFDIDFFKPYNDFYGHLAGDNCLYQVAKAIASAVKRAGDLSARYGGEEFVVLLPNTCAEGANIIARKICDRLERLKLPHARSEVDPYVTLSCGIATTIPSPQASPDSLIHHADCALYQAKAEGKNRICHASSNLHSSSKQSPDLSVESLYSI